MAYNVLLMPNRGRLTAAIWRSPSEVLRAKRLNRCYPQVPSTSCPVRTAGSQGRTFNSAKELSCPIVILLLYIG